MSAHHVEVTEDVVVGEAGGRTLHADVFTPEGGDRPAPAVLLVHGGSWRSGDRRQLRGYAILLAREGYVCLTAEYRLVREAAWPAQLEDVVTALRWLHDRADELGVDRARIAIQGNSAGGHLALIVAGGGRGPLGLPDGVAAPPPVAAAVAIYAPVRLPRTPDRLFEADELDGGRSDAAALASPIEHVSRSFPPTLLIHGSADIVVPVRSSLLMHEALSAAGVPAELHVFADMPHAFDSDPRLGRHCAGEMLLFLDRYLAPTRAVAGAT